MGLLKRKPGQEAAETGSGIGAAEKGFGWKEYLLYYLGYTMLMGLMAAVFVWMFLQKGRFASQADGVSQHYAELLSFSKWGKEVLSNFRETGSLQLPAFALNTGYGGDLYTSLGKYVIGDPFSFPAIFVPENQLIRFQYLMILVRFWLAGITFSAYSFFMGRKNRIGILAGALIYIFNGFTLSGMRHPCFLNPFVFFPLLLIGCEMYFRKKKPWLFLVMVFVSAVSSLPFFYMMMLMAALYVVWRSVRIHGIRHFGGVILDGISFLWYGLIGTLLSSFILLPVILQFLQDSRTDVARQIPFFWPLWYYRNFIDSFLSNETAALSESCTYMGFGGLALLCVFFIFVQRKRHLDLKAAFIGLTLLLMTPAAGYVMNGFIYPANFWMWAYALLIGTMTAAAIPEMEEAGWKKPAAGLLLFAAAIAVCVGWGFTFSRSSAQSVILGLFAMSAALIGRIMVLEKDKEHPDAALMGGFREKVFMRVQEVILLCTVLSIASAAFHDYAPGRTGQESDYLPFTQTAANMAGDPEGDMGAVLENKDELPVSFTADQWISRQDYEKLDKAGRQQVLMQGIVLEKDPGEDYRQMRPAAAQTAGAAAENRLVSADLDFHEMGGSSATEWISGHIVLTSPQILCIRIPCAAGWSAFADGNRVELLQADTMFSALLLPEGSHDIDLRYQTPGLRLGIAVSLGTLVLLVLFIVIYSIISAILHGRDRRLAAIPAGTYEAAADVQNTADTQTAADTAGVKSAGSAEVTGAAVKAGKMTEPEKGEKSANPPAGAAAEAGIMTEPEKSGKSANLPAGAAEKAGK